MAAVIAGVFLALVPPPFTHSTIEWTPKSAADNGALPLTRGQPDTVDVATSCARVRAGGDGLIFSTGGMTVVRIGDQLTVLTNPDGPMAKVSLPAAQCDVHVSYHLNTAVLSIVAGPNHDEVDAPAPVVDRLTTSSTPRIERALIRTQESGVKWSWLRGVAALLAMTLAGASTWRLIRDHWSFTTRQQRRRLVPIDAVVGASLVALAFVVPALLDDGWILTRSRELPHRRWFGDLYPLYGVNDPWLPQGFAHESVLAALQASGANFIHLRLLMAGLLLLAWLTLRRRVLVPTLGEQASRWPPIAATFIAFAGAWLITLRQEPVVVLLGVVTVAAVVGMRARPGPLPLLVGLLAASLAMATHQTGWVTVGPAIILLIFAGQMATRDHSAIPRLAAAIAAALAVTMVELFLVVDFHTLMNGIASFSVDSYNVGPTNEWRRYVSLLHAPAARQSTLFALALVMGVATLCARHRWRRHRLLWVSAVTWLAGLVLTASKWEWHFGVYAVPACLFTALMGDAMGTREATQELRPRWMLSLSLAGLGALVALRTAGPWGEGDLTETSWSSIPRWLLTDTGIVVTLICLGAIVAVGILADAGRVAAGTTTLCGLLVLPLVVSMAWVMRDASMPTWSPLEMNLRQLVGGNPCGVLDGRPLVVGATPLTATSSPTAAESAPRTTLHSRSGVHDGPLGLDLPILIFRPSDSHVVSPTYALPGSDEILVWTAASEEGAATVKALFGGDSTVTLTLPLTRPGLWQLHRLSVPPGASSVRFENSSPDGSNFGWTATTAPVAATYASAQDVFAYATAFVSPFDATTVPCVKLPDLSKGYWAKENYALVGSGVFSEHVVDLPQLTRTEVACLETGKCLEQLDYALANVTASSR